MRQWTDWFGTPKAIAQRLAFATAAGLFLGVIGPFGSYDVPLGVRLVGWTASFWAGALLLSLAIRTAHVIETRTGFPAWFALPVAVVVAAIPLAFIAATIFRTLRPSVNLLPPLDFYLQTVAITLPTSLGYLALVRLAARAGERSDPPPRSETRAANSARPSAFLNRLPAHLGRDLIALQMEDHYVRAHTPAGSDLILIPMRQAVDELGEIEGLRTHRSWWVARSAVEAVREDGRNLRLVLEGGLEAPVARANVAALRAAGWLDG